MARETIYTMDPQDARQRARTEPPIVGLDRLEGAAAMVDGCEACERTGPARHDGSQTPLRISQLVVRDEGGYVLVQGQVATANAGHLSAANPADCT